MSRSFLVFWLATALLGILTSFPAAADDRDESDCPLYMQKPANFSFLVAGEKWCPHKFNPTDTCYTCCQETDTVCCDDGTCMIYDQYCRYPDTCCEAPYCDKRCCSPDHGMPCGPVCAPKASTQCCNVNTGQLCAKSDSCCNDFCCPPSTHCCASANKCLPQGETCCGTVSCNANSQCCGNMPNKCCPSDMECIPETGGCCKESQICTGAPNRCCPDNYFCCEPNKDHCCPSGTFCCGDTCCVDGHSCCDGKCCLNDNACQPTHECCPPTQVCGNITCCPPGYSCCADNHCCPPGFHCSGNTCCPTGTSLCKEDQRCYPDGFTDCAGFCCPRGSTCINDHFGTKCCDGQYCGSTGRCCPHGTHCNEAGHCCNDGSKFCAGGSPDSCFPQESTCCGDGTACPSNYPVCLVEGGTDGVKVCCPAGFDAMCGGYCIPRDYRNCACCGRSCCVSPYGCDGNGRCFHDYTTGSWWSGHTHHHDEQGNDCESTPSVNRQQPTKINYSKRFLHKVLPESTGKKDSNGTVYNPPIQLPPPPTHKIDPASYPCFVDQDTMNDTCTAWDCLEEILGCGTKGPVLETKKIICTDFRHLSNFFNTEGQEFLNCTANCVTAEIVHVVRHNDVKPCCASLFLWTKAKERFECWAGCGFCTAYITNHLGFKAIFDESDPGANPSTIYANHCHLG